MLGGRDIRETIEKTFDKLYDDLKVKIDKDNPGRVHAIEASSCTRLAYYERKDPLPPDSASKSSVLLANGMRHSLAGAAGEYSMDGLTLQVNADLMIGGEYPVRFEVVSVLPEVPHPSHLLYINACLFALKKDEGFLIYVDADGKTAEFTVSKNNRMFEEIVRRARVLSTLLKEGKPPIVEPSELCLNCRYFERCYARKKDKEEHSGDLIAELFGKGKNR